MEPLRHKGTRVNSRPMLHLKQRTQSMTANLKLPQLSELLWLSEKRNVCIRRAVYRERSVWINQRQSDGTQLPALAGALALTPPITFNISYLAVICEESFSQAALSQSRGHGRDTETGLFLYLFKHAALNYSACWSAFTSPLKMHLQPRTKRRHGEERNLASGKRKHRVNEKKTSAALFTTCAGQHL